MTFVRFIPLLVPFFMACAHEDAQPATPNTSRFVSEGDTPLLRQGRNLSLSLDLDAVMVDYQIKLATPEPEELFHVSFISQCRPTQAEYAVARIDWMMINLQAFLTAAEARIELDRYTAGLTQVFPERLFTELGGLQRQVHETQDALQEARESFKSCERRYL